MKKSVYYPTKILLVAAIALFLFLMTSNQIVIAQNQANQTPSQRMLNGTANAEQNFRDKEQEFRQYRIFLFLDVAFKKTTIVSKILFGMHYAFELNYALAIVYWLLFLLFIPGIIRKFSGWSPWTSSLLAFAFNIAAAQIMVFKGLSLITIGLIGQGAIASIILFFFLLAILITFFITAYILANMYKKRRESRLFRLAQRDKNVHIGGPPPEEDYQRA